MPLGGARGQSLPISDWMLTNKHFGGGICWEKRKVEIKLKNRHSLNQKKCE